MRVDGTAPPARRRARRSRRRRARRQRAPRRTRAAASPSPSPAATRGSIRLAGTVVHGDAAAFIPLPRWDDYQLRASVALRRRERLTLTFLAADDHAAPRRLPPAIRRRLRSDRFDRSSYRVIAALRRRARRRRRRADAVFRLRHAAAPSTSSAPSPAELDVRSVVGGLRAALSPPPRRARHLRRRARSARHARARDAPRLADDSAARRRHHRLRPAARRRRRRRRRSPSTSSTSRPSSASTCASAR